VVYPPEDTEWRTCRYRVLDSEGYEWSFGSYRPGRQLLSITMNALRVREGVSTGSRETNSSRSAGYALASRQMNAKGRAFT
jgi:hypothetical protein